MSPGTKQSPPRAGKRTIGVEVHIYRGGNPYKRIKVKRSPATIGRDPEADVRLDSGHVSRIHAKLQFDDRGMKLIDMDSQNGFSVRGAKAKRAKITAEDTVSLCDFKLTFRPLVRKIEAFESDLSEGWADFDESDDDPDTGVHERPRPKPMFQDPTLAEDSVSETSPEVSPLLDNEDIDPDELEDYLVPDVPPLLTTMHEEANALLFTDQHARVGVEVIQTVGGRIFDVELLDVGQSSWWGQTPRGLAALLVVPTIGHFPMVSHTRHGEYRVQIPDGGHWKMFHRGDREVDVHRSGPLIGCLAEFKDQIEINYGAFTIYVRCVRMPPRVGSAVQWRAVAPDRLLLAALLLSLGLHTSAMAIPVEELPPLSFRLPYSDAFIQIDIAPEPAEQKPEEPPPPPVTPEPPPEPARLPMNWVPTSPQPNKRPRRRVAKPKDRTAPGGRSEQ